MCIAFDKYYFTLCDFRIAREYLLFTALHKLVSCCSPCYSIKTSLIVRANESLVVKISIYERLMIINTTWACVLIIGEKWTIQYRKVNLIFHVIE